MDSNLLLCHLRISAYFLGSAVPPLIARVDQFLPPNHEVTLCALELMFGVTREHNNSTVFPNIMGGFTTVHSTVNINEKQINSRLQKDRHIVIRHSM
jgi:hypothetical protein